MRAFIAIDLDEPIRARVEREIAHLEHGLGPAKAAWRFVRPASMHLTLRFLGNIDGIQRAGIEQALREIAASRSSIRLKFRGLGVFPSLLRPRVAWVGVEEGSAELISVAGEISAGVEPLGFAPEARAFTPHLTIGRARDPKKAPAISPLIVAREKTDYGTMTAREIILFRSELHPEGARYTKEATFPFRD